MFKNVILRYTLLFLLGGFSYCFIEILSRGYSHISMLIAGGICFVLIGNLNRKRKDMSLVGQMFLSAIIITGIELVTGLIVNVWLGLEVWNYSSLPYNFMGQICLLYTNIWFFLSILGILLDDYTRYWLMGEEKPHYKIL